MFSTGMMRPCASCSFATSPDAFWPDLANVEGKTAASAPLSKRIDCMSPSSGISVTTARTSPCWFETSFLIITKVKAQCPHRTDIWVWWSGNTQTQIKNKLLLISFCMFIQLRNSWDSILGSSIWRRLLGLRLLTRMLTWVLTLIWLTLASMRDFLNVSNTLIPATVTRIVPSLSTDIAWFVSFSTLLALVWHWLCPFQTCLHHHSWSSCLFLCPSSLTLTCLLHCPCQFYSCLCLLFHVHDLQCGQSPLAQCHCCCYLQLYHVKIEADCSISDALSPIWELLHVVLGYVQFSLRFKLKWVFKAPVMQRSAIAHFSSSPKTVPALRVSSKASSKRKTCAWSGFDIWKAGQAVTEDNKASPLAWVLGLIDSVSCLRASNPLPAGAARMMLNALFFTSPARSP